LSMQPYAVSGEVQLRRAVRTRSNTIIPSLGMCPPVRETRRSARPKFRKLKGFSVVVPVNAVFSTNPTKTGLGSLAGKFRGIESD
jgi:hypothetical protein